MPIPYKHKRSTAAGVEPTTLQDGEIAINVAAADPKIFFKDSANTIRAFSLASYASATHSHVAADISDFTSVANVVSVNAKTGVVSISHTDVTAASASHTHAASDITSGTFDAARLPLATTGAAGAVIVGTGLGVSSGTVSVTYGTTSGTACQGNDSRLSDTRTPTDGSVTTAKIANDAVTYAKIQNVSAQDRLLGRSSAGAGDVEEITCTAFGRSLIDDADAAAARTTLSVQPTASPAFTGAATFDNTGNVVPLTVTNTGTANSFVVNDASGDTTPFVIDANGRVVVGGTAASSEGDVLSVVNAAAATNNVSRLFVARASAPSSSTSAHNGFQSSVGTDAASFNVDALRHFIATQGAFGAGSTVTNQFGFAALSTITGATNNYGFYSDIASGTGRWNFYANGTAASYFGGQVQISAGSASACGVAFSGDTNTGLAQIGGADTASLVTAGVERVRVGSGGGVGIGTTTTTDALNVVGITSHYQSSNGTPALGSKQYYSACFENFSAGYGLALGGVQGGNGAAYLQVQSFSSAVAYPMYLQALGGEVLIGTTTDNGAYLLQVNSQIYATNATIATSDARFKTNVESLTDATAVIEALRPVAFDFLPHAERNFATERQVGLIAQEAQEALAGCDYAASVVAQCGDHLGLAYEKLVPVLVKALQESNARISALEERLNHA